ncbi:hypothetical protein [Sulfuricurvum sp.]|uniref:hypothetical protein n=1 Tax=Sulfuricurvum sp. TaxID=2025608 RepID=UPI002D3CA3EF|nr:hypothetical protein [Sulfuricurvum sp.]HZF69832.1 hypothetical protein [Sulfuricurvum sp.]
MRGLIAVSVIAFILSGCTASKGITPIDQTIPINGDITSLTIIAPQEQYLPGQIAAAGTNYDYFIDCLDERCKIGKMHMLQYITLSPSTGKHILFAKLSKDGFTNTVAITGFDPISVPFESLPGKRTFISHSYKFSIGSLLGPIIPTSSTLSTVDDHTGQLKLQKVLDTTSIFGDKMAGFGGKGTKYEK